MSITTIIIVISGLSIAFASVAFFNWCRGQCRDCRAIAALRAARAAVNAHRDLEGGAA